MTECPWGVLRLRPSGLPLSGVWSGDRSRVLVYLGAFPSSSFYMWFSAQERGKARDPPQKAMKEEDSPPRPRMQPHAEKCSAS